MTAWKKTDKKFYSITELKMHNTLIKLNYPVCPNRYVIQTVYKYLIIQANNVANLLSWGTTNHIAMFTFKVSEWLCDLPSLSCLFYLVFI